MEQVSWQLYVMLMGVVVGVYYLYVVIRYYRQDIQNVVSRALKPPDSKATESIQLAELEAFNRAAQLLEATFEELSGQDINQEQLLATAHRLLSGFSGLENQVVRQIVEQLVVSKAKAIFGLDLSRSDLETMW